MKEYIVPFVTEEAADQFNRYHGVKEEIIRYKDCVWLDGRKCRNTYMMPLRDDDFCSYGERKENG